ncbi:MAG TPA: ABC-2 family transporter protein [Candidatus Binataceae bacterium]|nr:ABC-2 family transporter protein [Candidatus Binataceae bacterium]
MSVVARRYLSVFRMRFLLLLQYRTAAVAGFATQCWWGLIKVMVFAAFYRSTVARQPIDFAQAVTYTWLGQAFLALLPWAADVDIAEMVRSGAVSYERLRPLDTYFYWYARSTAWNLARAVPRSLLMFAFAGLLLPLVGLGGWRLRLPSGGEAAALFAAAMCGQVLLSSAFVMLLNLGCLVTLSDRGVNAVAVPFVLALSGNIIPLQFFPSWLQRFMFAQPFAGLLDIPNRIYFGGLRGAVALMGIAHIVVWASLLVLGGHRLMRTALSRLEVQGG